MKTIYFHQLTCSTCGSEKTTTGFNMHGSKRKKWLMLEIDCAECGEPIAGYEMPEEKIQFTLRTEYEAEKLKLPIPSNT